MAEGEGLDWPAYVRSLGESGIRELAIWLAAQGLLVGEFQELADRLYSAAPEAWRAQSQVFVTRIAVPAAERYAFRKRRFASLLAMLQEALVSGAMAGEVAPQDLELPIVPQTSPPSVEELLGALERVRGGQA